MGSAVLTCSPHTPSEQFIAGGMRGVCTYLDIEQQNLPNSLSLWCSL